MSTKTVYQTDPEGVFLYETKAHALPLSPGRFNIPFGAYEDAPPIAPDGSAAVRVGISWEVFEDHRSDVLYVVETGAQYSRGADVDVEGVAVSYSGLGPIPAWLTLTPPPAPEPETVTETPETPAG
ncbi:MAG: phage tail protein [Oxalobacter sp.]|jgi:hypothetical protein|nr:MAG: phage tail protein [Oxalobacter sp.]